MALVEAAKELVWLTMLLGELGLSRFVETPVLHSDSTSTIALSLNPEHHQRTKHIRIRCHFLRDLVKSRVLNIQAIAGLNNPTNIFTKPLPAKDLKRHSASLGGCSR